MRSSKQHHISLQMIENRDVCRSPSNVETDAWAVTPMGVDTETAQPPGSDDEGNMWWQVNGQSVRNIKNRHKKTIRQIGGSGRDAIILIHGDNEISTPSNVTFNDGGSTPKEIRQKTELSATRTHLKDRDISDIDRDRLSSDIRCQLIRHSGELGNHQTSIESSAN